MNLRKKALPILLVWVLLMLIVPNVNAVSYENSQNREIKVSANSSKQKSQADLKNISIKGITLTPNFSSDVYEYKVDVDGNVSNLEIETEYDNTNVSIDIVGNENLQEGENVITLLVYNEKTKQNSTYQIIVNKAANIKIEEENTVNNAIEKANKIRRILLLGAFGVIMVMGIIWAIIKHKSAVEEDEKYEYDEEDKKKINFEEEEILSQVANKKKGKHF